MSAVLRSPCWAKRGYTVEASTGRAENKEYLKDLGASHILSRDDVYDGRLRPLASGRWAGVVDPVGGEQLASILGQLHYEGAVAVSGLTGGAKVPTQVYPFILRGNSLIGIDSVNCPMEKRKKVWHRMANDLKIKEVFNLIKVVHTLEEVPETLETILQGKTRGRSIVKLRE